MSAFKNKRRVIAVTLGVVCLGFLAVISWRWFGWRERPDRATGLAVELLPHHQVVKLGGPGELSITLVNRGNREVTLVEPGDGSSCGWRTPLMEWSTGPFRYGLRCGNVNPL